MREARALIERKGFLHFLTKDVWDGYDRSFARLLAKHYQRGFHRLYYYSEQTWPTNTWLGVTINKCPMDLLIYQEIIYETRPQVIIETGTATGGSALFFASLCDLLGRGEVITVDIEDNCQVRHPRITRIIGSSTDSEIAHQISMRVQGRSAMVVLDSDHRRDHVLRELELYSVLVPMGHYMIVEDTNIHGHPVLRGYGEGPAEAVAEFLRRHDQFMVDHSRAKHMLTFNPGGYLKRIRKTDPHQDVLVTE
jgi:cephalosporin hydroxylase